MQVPVANGKLSREQIAHLMSTYIVTNKAKFFPTADIFTAIIANDKLSQAFGVNKVHQSMIIRHMETQMISVEDYEEELQRQMQQPDSTTP